MYSSTNRSVNAHDMITSSSASALLTLTYAGLEDVARDLDMVIHSSSHGEWSWEGASEEERKEWEQFVEDPSSISEPKVAGLGGKVQVVKDICLSFSLISGSQGKEEGAEKEAVVDVSAPTLAPSSVAGIKKALLERSRQWKEEGIESLFLFDLLTTAQTLAADLSASSGPNDNQQTSSSAPELPGTTNSPASIDLTRAIFWSHHLKAPSKLKDFNNWCPELGVWGIVRVGWPGYLCFEGESSAVEEMVKRVKGLQWHAIQLRVQKTRTWSGEVGAQINNGGRSLTEQASLSCALAKGHLHNVFAEANGDIKVRTGCQVIEDLGELVTRLRQCKLDENEIEDALGIRMGGSS